MQVTETLSDGLKRNYTVVLPVADLESRRTERLTTLGKTLRLPGFRPGKVPMPIVKQRYGTAVSAEVLEESVNEATQKVLSERGLRPAQQPKVDLVTENPTALTSDLEFTVDAGTAARHRPAGFQHHRTDPPQGRSGAGGGRQGARADRQIQPHAGADPGGDAGGPRNRRGAGEVLTIDYDGKIDGVAFEGGTGTDTPVEIGGTGFIPGFAEQLEGARPGETRTINVTFPENYGKAELAGKAATFDITVKQLSTQIIPPIDDDLAKKLGADGSGRGAGDGDQPPAAGIRWHVADAAEEGAARCADRAGRLPGAGRPSPTRNSTRSGSSSRLPAQAGTQDEEDKGKDDDTLKAEYRAIAERRVRLGLLLAEIGRINNITVTEQELNRALYQRAMQYPGQEAQMLEFFRKYPQLTNSVRGPLLEDKVVDFVLELAKVTDTVVTPEELAKDPEAEATHVRA